METNNMEEYQDIQAMLTEGENLLLTIKPNKKRFTLTSSIATLLFSLLFGSIFLLLGILIVTGVIIGDGEFITGGIFFIVFGSIPLISAIINVVGRFVRYKNTLYVATDRRLIIRSGFVGVDYKEISIKSIQAINVRVDALDKLVKPNTGTIYFGTTSIPIINDKSGKTTGFQFENIDNPYENYKKLKEIISIE